jgi:hypothetical protein
VWAIISFVFQDGTDVAVKLLVQTLHVGKSSPYYERRIHLPGGGVKLEPTVGGALRAKVKQ